VQISAAICQLTKSQAKTINKSDNRLLGTETQTKENKLQAQSSSHLFLVTGEFSGLKVGGEGVSGPL